jgi:hypothetical protein
MKSQIANSFLGLALLGMVASASAQTTININLWDAGNGQTGLAWSWSGDAANSGGATVAGSFVGIMGFEMPFGTFINNMAVSSAFVPVDFGSLENQTTSVSESFNAVQLIPDYNGENTCALGIVLGYQNPSQFYTMIPTSVGDQVGYTPGVDSVNLDVPFADFNTGTYQIVYPGGMVFNQDTTFNLDVGTEPVPEPSTMALAGLGGVSLLLYRRRK